MKKFKLLSLLLLTVLTIGILVACGNEQSPANGNEAAAGDVEEPEGSEDAQVPEPTAELAGGNLTVYLPSPAGLADDLIAAFETAHPGVTVDQFQGTTGEILARLEAEAANPIADVVILASWSDGLALREQGWLHAFEPAAIDDLHPGFVSEDQTMFGTSASAVGVAYNTTMFDSFEADWTELAADEFSGELVFPDPALSGSANDFLAGFMHTHGEAGWETWEALADHNMIVPGPNAPALEAVVSGERGVLVAGVDWNVFNAIDHGEPLGFFYPAGGTVINPRPAMVLNTSHHLELAEAFVDFLLSDEAQQMVVEAFLIPGRVDIRSDRRPNVDEINALDTDWEWMMNHANEISETFNGLFN